MLVAVVPDVHQTKHWSEIKSYLTGTNPVDKLVFLGDYYDTHESNPPYKDQGAVDNLQEIIDLKKEYPDKVDLLFGNHDLHYLDKRFRASQFQSSNYEIFHKILIDNFNLFKVAVTYGDWVFSHAGLSRTYLERVLKLDLSKSKSEVIEEVNQKVLADLSFISYQYNPFDYSGTGDTKDQGPLWIRPNSLIQDAAYTHQVVGHTGLAETAPRYLQYKENKVVFLDSEDKDILLVFDTETLDQEVAWEVLGS